MKEEEYISTAYDHAEYLKRLRDIRYLLEVRDQARKGIQLHSTVADALKKSPSSSEQVHAISVFNDAIKELNQQIGSKVYALLLVTDEQLQQRVRIIPDGEEKDNE